MAVPVVGPGQPRRERCVLMRSALLRERSQPLSIEEVQATALAPDEVLVKIAGTGICHTDLSAIDGTVPFPLPAVFGHEGAGVVEAVGDSVTTVAVGGPLGRSLHSSPRCSSRMSGAPPH